MLLHSLESFPADVPTAVFGESGIKRFLTTIPASAHHGDSGEQSPVAREIAAQTVCGLEVMSVFEICILLSVDEEGLEGGLGFSETGGGHGNHAVVPAPGGLPVPVLHHPVEGLSHFFYII